MENDLLGLVGGRFARLDGRPRDLGSLQTQHREHLSWWFTQILIAPSPEDGWTYFLYHLSRLSVSCGPVLGGT